MRKICVSKRSEYKLHWIAVIWQLDGFIAISFIDVKYSQLFKIEVNLVKYAPKMGLNWTLNGHKTNRKLRTKKI